jgi:drug/metabolite transporter (DMT)-like permease
VTPSRDLVFGLAAALGFGSADFLARQATHRIGFFSTLFFLQTLGALGLLPLAFVYERSLWQVADPWVLIGALGFLNLFAALALYRAFEYGVLSVVTPLVSMAPAITTALALLILGEHLGRTVLAGIALVLIGIIALTRSAVLVSGPPPKNARIGLVSAFAALAGFGVLAFALKYAIGAIGPMTTIVAIRLVGVAAVLPGLMAGRVRLVGPARDVWPLMIGVIVIDTAAFVTYATGIGSGSVAIVTTLSGLFSVVTVGLAALVLKERLAPASYLSIGVMLTGVVLILRG